MASIVKMPAIDTTTIVSINEKARLMRFIVTKSGRGALILEHLSRLAASQVRLASCRGVAKVSFAAVSVAALSCALAPLAPTVGARTGLDALATTPAPVGFAAEARLVVSRALAAQELQRAVDDQLRSLADIAIDVPFLGAMHLRPRARVQSVDVERGSACGGCLILTVDVDGLLLATDAPIAPIEWRGRLHGAVMVEAHKRDDGTLEVQIAPTRLDRDDDGWRVELEVDGLGGLESLVTAGAQQQLRRLLLNNDAAPVVVAVLPPAMARQVRGFRADARIGAVVIDLALVALTPGVVSDDAPIANDGAALLVPEDTLRGIANAALLRDAELPPGWSVWCTGLSVDGSAFRLALEAWQPDPARPHRIEASGRFRISDDGSFHVDIDHIDQPATRDFNALDPLIRAALERETVRALQQATLPALLLPDGRSVQLVDVVDRGDLLEVRGNIEPVVLP
jgi:hypothetical protein